jgi:hypothetical protein
MISALYYLRPFYILNTVDYEDALSPSIGTRNMRSREYSKLSCSEYGIIGKSLSIRVQPRVPGATFPNLKVHPSDLSAECVLENNKNKRHVPQLISHV